MDLLRFDPDADDSELKRSHEVVSPSVVTGRESLHLSDAIEEAFNEVARAVDPTAEGEKVLEDPMIGSRHSSLEKLLGDQRNRHPPLTHIEVKP